MKFRKKIALAVFFVFTVFSFVFAVLVYVGKISFDLKELKNQSTQLLADMYRLNFEVKSIMTATAITTAELRAGLTETISKFQSSFDIVEKNSRTLMTDSELSTKLRHAQALWKSTRRDLDLVIKHLDMLIELGIDRRTGLISRTQYSYLLALDEIRDGRERYHLLSLENAIESFTASSYSYSLVFSGLNSEIAASADAYIRYSIFTAITMVGIVVMGSLIFFYLFSRQALVRQLDRLLDEAMKKEEEKREAQLRALQYQINPHFLYNTLGSIRSAAVGAKQEKIAEMLKILSRLLRNTITRTSSHITLRDEMVVLSDYIAILQIRYKGRISVEAEFDPRVEDLLMPSLLLQPLIENAVLHGLSARLNDPEGNAKLRISANIHHGNLVFEIFDNGIGMDETEIRRAFIAPPKESGRGGVHIGIRNLHERIQIQCGKAYGLSIQGRKGEYTLVKIKLPYIPREGHAA
jgi:sensor histidine kinase YesM